MGEFQTNRGNGRFNFTPNITNNPANNTGGHVMAAFLLGAPSLIEQDYLLADAAIRTTEYGVYVADDWRATETLTLNLGLRYELDTPPTEASNQWANFDPITATVLVAGRIQFKHYDGRRLTIYGKGEKVRYLLIIGPEATSRLERHILVRQPGTEEFLLNPVVLWAHQRAMPPVGTCLSLDVQPGRVVAVTKFAAGVPLAEDVFRLYAQGVLRGWSVGLLPRRAVPQRGGRGLRIEAWDLLEYSAVPVPENPEALTLAVEKGLVRDRGLRDWLLRRTADPFAELVA